MVEFLWNAVSAVCLMAEFVMVARYIFLLPNLGNKKAERILYGTGIMVLCIIAGFCETDTYACIFLLMAGAYFAICSTGRNWKAGMKRQKACLQIYLLFCSGFLDETGGRDFAWRSSTGFTV